MIAVPNPNMIKYTSATVENGSTFNRLKMFFELRRDEDSPFTLQEMLDAYSVCSSGRSFVARPGDHIVLVSNIPFQKGVYSRLLVRKANGLYGLLSLVPGMVLADEKLQGDYERTYYVINPQKDSRLLQALARGRAIVEQVGVVTHGEHKILLEDGEFEDVTAEEQPEKIASIPNDGSFAKGYVQGFISAFEGGEAQIDGEPAMALGAFSAYFDIRADLGFSYSGARKNDGLFLFTVSAPSGLPNRRARSVYKLLKKYMKKGYVSGCAVFNDGNLSKAVSRISEDGLSGDFDKPLADGVWYVLISSSHPVGGGTYIGRLHSLF